MRENLAKRLIFISRVIVTVLIITVPVFLLKQEENDRHQDVEAFSVISQVNDKKPLPLDSNLFNGRVLPWLKREHKELYDTHIGLRQTITNWLLENKLTTQDELGGIKNDAKGSGFTLFSYELTDSERKILFEIPPKTNSVKQHLERFDVFSKPRSIHIVTRLIENLLDISNLIQIQDVKFERLYLDGNEVILKFRFRNPSRQGNPSDIRLAVDTQKVRAPAILTFAQENTTNAEANLGDSVVEALTATVKSDRQRLDAVYANVPFQFATQIASERLIRTYGTVDVLGFSLARKNLPWGILVVMISLLGASIITLRTAIDYSLKIVSEVVSEDAFDILLDSMIGRVAIWIVVPLLAIAASLPTSPLSEMEVVLLTAGALLTLLLGYSCVLLSNKL